jgi:hypothetical protein
MKHKLCLAICDDDRWDDDWDDDDWDDDDWDY